MSIDPEMQRFGTSATVVDAFGAGDSVISVPFGHCDSGQPAKIFQWSGSDVVLKRLLRSRYAWLRMATKLDPYRETARMALEPWLVEAALADFDRKLSPAEQRTIVKATRTPHKVKWPEWWSERP